MKVERYQPVLGENVEVKTLFPIFYLLMAAMALVAVAVAMMAVRRKHWWMAARMGVFATVCGAVAAVEYHGFHRR